MNTITVITGHITNIHTSFPGDPDSHNITPTAFKNHNDALTYIANTYTYHNRITINDTSAHIQTNDQNIYLTISTIPVN